MGGDRRKRIKKERKVKKIEGKVSVKINKDKDINALFSRVYQRMNRDRKDNLDAHRAGVEAYSTYTHNVGKTVMTQSIEIGRAKEKADTALMLSLGALIFSVICLMVVCFK